MDHFVVDGCLIILGLTLLIGARSVKFGFVADDNLQVVHNPAVESADVRSIWTTGTWQLLGLQGVNYLRPVQVSLFAFEWSLFGSNPAGYHFLELLLYAAAAAAWFLLLLGARVQPRLALCAAALFVTHPANSAALAWISCSADLLVLLFGMAALYFWVLSEARYSALIGSFFWLLALLSKEWAVMVPALGVLLFAAARQRKTKWRRFVLRSWSAPIVGALWLAYRAIVLRAPTQPSAQALGIQWPVIVGGLFKKYLLTLVVLRRPALWETFWPQQYLSWGNVLFASLCLVMFAVWAIWLWRMQRHVAAVAVAAVLVSLAPAMAVTQIAWPIVFNSRYLFFVTPFYCLALVETVFLLLKGRAAVVTAAVALVFVTMGYGEIGAWHDDGTFFQEAARRSPDSPVAVGQLARLRSRETRHAYPEEAASALAGFERAIELTRGLQRRDLVWVRIDAETDYAELLLWRGEWQPAIRALEAEPRTDSAWLNLYLARAHEHVQQYSDAERVLRRGLIARPEDLGLRTELVRLFLREHRCADATEQLAILPQTDNGVASRVHLGYMIARLCSSATLPANSGGPSLDVASRISANGRR